MPPYHYVWFDVVEDFVDKNERNHGYISQYKDVHAYA